MLWKMPGKPWILVNSYLIVNIIESDKSTAWETFPSYGFIGFVVRFPLKDGLF